MDKCTFTVEIVRVVAWPVTILGFFVIFRRPVGRLLTRLQELKIQGAEMKFVESRIVDGITSDLNVVRQEIDPSRQLNRQKLKALLRRLPRAARLLIVLYYFEEQTIPQIATAVDMPEQQVREMHRATLKQLRAWISQPPSDGFAGQPALLPA